MKPATVPMPVPRLISKLTRSRLRQRAFWAGIGLLAFISTGHAEVPSAPGWTGAINAIDYSPSGVASLGELNAGVSDDRLRADLTKLSKLTHHIRTYSTAANMTAILAIAHDLGLKISVGIWLGADPAANDAEVARGIAMIAANPHLVDRVIVGNEVLLRNDLSASALIGYIQRVKHALPDFSIAVTTAETWGYWQRHPELAEVCDVIAVHILPYWDGVDVAQAAPYVGDRLAEIRRLFPGKPVVLAEIGWPSAGFPRGAAVPSRANQAYFIRTFLQYAAANHVDYYLLEAFDQPWKIVQEGVIGTSWGLLDASGEPKFSLTGPVPQVDATSLPRQ